MSRRFAALLLSTSLLAAGAAGNETARILEVLELRPGDRAADVGAGDGQWARSLAERVGSEGRVYATEVDEALVAGLREVAAEQTNLVAIRGTEHDTGLDAGCCDAILLRLVYHHFTDPAAMRASLRRALRPGGRIAVVDILPQEDWRQLPGVPDRGGHGVRPDALIEEMTSDGFVVLQRIDDWRADDEDRYCVVFELPADEAGSSSDPRPRAIQPARIP